MSDRGMSDPDEYIPPMNACGHHNEAIACRDTVEYWMATIRLQIAQATGPLMGSIKVPGVARTEARESEEAQV